MERKQGNRGDPERPNILWIISEDTSPDMACYGTPLVKTPNFDRLAGEGIRFTRAYATAPVCSPSRSAFNTGMYQTSIGAHQHRTRKKQALPEPVRVVADYFREAGYYTTNCSGLNADRKGKTDWNFSVDHPPFDGTDWSQRKPGQPFFAQVNLRLTHRVFERDPDRPVDPAKVELPPYYPDHPLLRRDWADYLESIQVVDAQVGKVLERLEEEGLAENTAVFYFGDHGRPHVRGKQFLYEGGVRVPLMVRWPGKIPNGVVSGDLVSLIDLAPAAMSIAGIDVPDHLQGRDFLVKGRDPREVVFAARDRCDGTVDRIRCVCIGRYKYIRNFMPDRPYNQFNAYKLHQYPAVSLMEVLHKEGKLNEAQARYTAPNRPVEELYDLEKDPYEIHNLAGDPAHREMQENLSRRLDQWIKETGDMGETPEDPAVQADELARMKAANENWWKRKKLPADTTHEQHLAYWEKRLLKN